MKDLSYIIERWATHACQYLISRDWDQIFKNSIYVLIIVNSFKARRQKYTSGRWASHLRLVVDSSAQIGQTLQFFRFRIFLSVLFLQLQRTVNKFNAHLRLKSSPFNRVLDSLLYFCSIARATARNNFELKSLRTLLCCRKFSLTDIFLQQRTIKLSCNFQAYKRN